METIDLLIKKFNELKQELSDETLEKGLMPKEMKAHMINDSHRASLINKPMVSKPHMNAMPSPEEHAARASMYSDFMQPASGGVRKTINNSYSSDPNMAMSRDEKISLSKNGQWNLEMKGSK